MGYTPLFDTILTGTLAGRWPHNGIWALLLSRATRDGVIDEAPAVLAALIGMPVEQLMESIRDFMAPDRESRTHDLEGRRLVLIDPNRGWGWRIVNHGKYRDKARKKAYDDVRTESGRDKARKQSARHPSDETSGTQPGDVPTRPDDSRRVPPSYAEAEAKTDKSTDGGPGAATGAGSTESASGNVPRQTQPAFGNLLVAKGALDPWMLDFREIYPKRAGDPRWKAAWRAGRARIAEGHAPDELLAGARRYAEYIRAKGDDGSEFVQQASRFLGPEKPFLLAWSPPVTAQRGSSAPTGKTPAERAAAQEAAWDTQRTRARQMGFRMPLAGEALDNYRDKVNQHVTELEADRRRGSAPTSLANLLQTAGEKGKK